MIIPPLRGSFSQPPSPLLATWFVNDPSCRKTILPMLSVQIDNDPRTNRDLQFPLKSVYLVGLYKSKVLSTMRNSAFKKVLLIFSVANKLSLTIAAIFLYRPRDLTWTSLFNTLKMLKNEFIIAMNNFRLRNLCHQHKSCSFEFRAETFLFFPPSLYNFSYPQHSV